MDIRATIMQKKGQDASNLLNKFSNAPEVNKGITPEQFNERYEAGYDVFDQEAIEKFKDDALEKGDDTGAILAEIESLHKVEVVKGGETKIFFVKKQEDFDLEDLDGEENLI